MRIIRLLLIPFSLLYGIITWIRNFCFDFGILPSKRFPVTTICVGNLRAGGTGKTPHIEYLINMLSHKYSLAVLSRGYGRKTKGFIQATEHSTASEIGDEPLQIFKKFPGVTVAVDEKRVTGIEKILDNAPKTKAILLDDAFQHRYVKPDLSILLTEYSDLYCNDFVLPTGNLREFATGASRADIIVVTKTPQIFSPLDKRAILDKIKPQTYQRVYFSYTVYGDLVSFQNPNQESPFTKEFYFERNYSIMLLTGIAKPINLEYYLKSKVTDLVTLAFPDHHAYTEENINLIRKKFDDITNANKIIITTEKDSMRLQEDSIRNMIADLPLFYIPLEVIFHSGDQANFNDQILNHVR